MYTRELEVVKVTERKAAEGKYKVELKAEDQDKTVLKFVVQGDGDLPLWARDGKLLNVTIEVDRS